VFGTELYAAGSFSKAGSDSASHIAKWDGSAWTAVGSGLNGDVAALAVCGTDLFAGGRFTVAGGKISAYAAKARISSIANSIAATGDTAAISFSGVVGYQYDVQRCDNLLSPVTWTTLTISPLSPANDGSFTFVDTNAPPGTSFYRSALH